MKESLHKQLLSHLMEVHVESVSSEYNNLLHVVLKNGRYQLCTENAVYSYADKYDNYRESFNKMKLPDHPDTNILLLGFGMGSIPYMLEKVFMKKYVYTGVEIDPMIIYLASKYTLVDLHSEISIIEADAAYFIKQNQEIFDIICIDIFVDDKIPEYFQTEEFLLKTKEALTTNGVILFNHLAYTKNDISEAKKYYDAVFKAVFPDSMMIKVHKNYMMVSNKKAIIV